MKNKKIFYSFFIAVGLPAVSYFIFTRYSNKVVVLPPKYFYDTTIVTIKNGKKIEDTQWHSIKNFTLTNQIGERVSLYDLKNKIMVVNFIFTRCSSFCPTLVKNMKILQEAFYKKKDLAHFVSLSVDPEYDNPEILKSYGDKFKIYHDTWWMLTGSTNTIYELAYNEFHVATQKNGETDFIHTDRFILIDKKKRIRGYYGGQDSLEIKRLADDIVFLSLEKH